LGEKWRTANPKYKQWRTVDCRLYREEGLVLCTKRPRRRKMIA
jgi:hypothetical protein